MLTITDLSRATKVRSSALRFYEKLGLLEPLRRTKAGYRQYPDDAPDRVQFIHMAQDAGLTLEDIRAILEPRGSSATCGAVRGILAKRLTQVREKLATLKRMEAVLEQGLTCRPRNVSKLCSALCRAAGSACQ